MTPSPGVSARAAAVPGAAVRPFAVPQRRHEPDVGERPHGATLHLVELDDDAGRRHDDVLRGEGRGGRPAWADPGNGREEPWHWEYAGT